MICDNCQTTLPDQAVACWKCGKPLVQVAPPAIPTSPPTAVLPLVPSKPPEVKKNEPDLLHVIVTFVFTAGFFVCAGWAVPFTVWGLIISSGKQYPELSGLLDVLSGVAFIVSAIGFFAGIWWGAYKISTRLAA